MHGLVRQAHTRRYPAPLGRESFFRAVTGFDRADDGMRKGTNDDVRAA